MKATKSFSMKCSYYRKLHASFVLADACRPFLPPENGYYVNDIQWIYIANSSMDSIQVACKDGYTLVDNYGDASNGIAYCQSRDYWDRHFYCLGE